MKFDSRPAAFPRLADVLTPQTNSFGVLRFAMAATVLISHSYLYSAGTSDAEPLQSWLGRSLGECAVQVFFFLSGVMVAQSFDRSRNLVDFIVARALRIFPALILCVLATAFVLGLCVTSLSPADYLANSGLYGYIAKTLTLSSGSAPLPGVFETNAYAGYVNSSLWTLKYEVACYGGLALIGVAGLFERRWGTLAIAALAVVVATVSLSLPSDPAAYGFVENLRYFIVFFFGGVLAYLLREYIVITALMLLPLVLIFVLSVRTQFAEVGAMLFLGYAALWAATKTWGPLRGICNRFDTSFGIYIFAGPIQQSLLWLVPSLAPMALAAVTFVIVLPLAFISWIAVEKPMLRLRSYVVGLLNKPGGPISQPG
ncbi:acyltransferase [Hyphomicrobium sp.]|jgi:peptidoglycan/LPS O-acetylase OafA/YrhL|uniref:acyltransferase family protein n=1 Tax=Hyphomicrobium sp. TaxID=82 RepID=UPI002C61B595|nr:acyltransferase [Hyphomicrobium sp.]HVZ04156.1 acyltransferase [Hyphomicrobium sp.]